MQLSMEIIYLSALVLITVVPHNAEGGKEEAMAKAMEMGGKLKDLIGKGRTGLSIVSKFLPCTKMVSEIQGNMKKLGPSTKGMQLCLEKAVPKPEDIKGKEDVEMSKEELRAKIKTCFGGFVAAARGKDDMTEDQLADVKSCFMDAAQSISSAAGGGDEGGE